MSASASAQERSPDERPTLALRVGAGQTDNLSRTATGERSDIKTLGIALGASRSSSRLDGKIAADLELREYGAAEVEDDDELVGSLDAGLEVFIVPERFRWDFAQSFGQTRTDALAPVGPNNRERTRVFSTGPELLIPLASRTVLAVSSRVSRRRFDDSTQLDSDSTLASLGAIRQIDRATQVGLVLERTENDFEGDAEPFDIRTFALSYARTFSSGGMEVSIGRGELEVGNRTERTPVARFAWSRGVGARSRLNVWGNRELTDAGELFSGGGLRSDGFDSPANGVDAVDINGGRLAGIVLAPDPLRRSSAGVDTDLVARRGSLRIGITKVKDEFESTSALDNDMVYRNVTLRRRFGRLWHGSLSLTASTQKFAAIEEKNEDRTAGLIAERQLGRNLLLSIRGERNRRSAGVDSYDENVYMISLGYVP